jgi:hypothetical protein
MKLTLTYMYAHTYEPHTLMYAYTHVCSGIAGDDSVRASRHHDYSDN